MINGYDSFKIAVNAWLGLITAVLSEYLIKFRPGLSERFVLRADCQRISDQLYRENREDHKEIFKKLDKLCQKISEIQAMINDHTK